ncbi:CbtB domain-containing protein [Polaromonas sp. YR568]|uniref:CbtB domain-containing protein n=1 Tax=Polaromonas sp. YR568 TaxID=1855301 RepID=UPI00398BF12B
MTEPTTLTHSPSDTLTPVNPGLAVLRPLLGAAALGFVVLYGVAFAESPLAHNAAHDVRHVTVKPCH